MLSQEGHMTVALRKSVIGTTYLLIIVWQAGLTDMGTLRVIQKATESMEVFKVGTLYSIRVQRVISAISCIWKSWNACSCISLSPHILSNSLSHLPHWHLCYLLGPVKASFPAAEKTSDTLRQRSILQWTKFMMMPSLNPFRFAWRIKAAYTKNTMCPVWNPH